MLERGARLMPVEIKSGRTVASDYFLGLARFHEMAGDGSERGFLVYGGDREEQRRVGIALPWRRIKALVARND